MKKVLFLLDHLQYSDGVAKVLVDICNTLPKDRYDITVRSVFKYDMEFIKSFDSNIRVETIFGFYFRGMSKLVNRMPKRVLYHMATKGETYDIEVAFQYGIPTIIIGNSYNRKAIHIAWMHGYDEGLTLRTFYKKMDTVVCVSKANAERLSAESAGMIKSTYCYNLVDDIELRELAKDSIDLNADIHPILVSVGRHTKEKGYERLINILIQLKEKGYEFQCWLIGDGPEHSHLVQIVSNHQMNDTIVLTGAQTNPHKYTSKADVFICSSFREGYSTACTEAAALGIPIITTAVSGGWEIIEKADCGLLVELDDRSLMNGIEEILLNKGLLEHWKEIAGHSAGKFSKNRMAHDLINTFNEISKIKK